MIVLVVLISLVWVACGVVCMTIIYRAGIEEGIRHANAPADLPAVAGKVRRDVGQECERGTT